MATRTPGLQQRSQYHRNWGNYTTWTAAMVGDLPNQSGNAITSPEWDKLEVGDLAYVTTTNPGVYFCTDPGSNGGGDAQWTLLAAGGSVVQTIRDAHEIVVGQSSAPYNDVALVDADVLDPGDGTGIETALGNAATLILGGFNGVDVRIRPCDITIVPANLTGSLPLTIPSNTRLIGAGRDISFITGGDGAGGTTQDMFSLGRGSIEDLYLTSPSPTAAPAAGTGMVRVAGSGEVKRCRFTLSVAATARNGTTIGINLATALNSNVRPFLVEDCEFEMDDLIPDGQVSLAISVGAAGGFSRSVYDPVVRGCVMRGGNQFLTFQNIEGGVVQDCQHDDAISPNADISVLYTVAPAAADPVRSVRIHNYRVTITDDTQGGQVGIAVLNTQNGSTVVQGLISDVDIIWTGTTQPATSRDGIFIGTNGGAGAAIMEDFGLVNINIRGNAPVIPEHGIHLQTSGQNGDALRAISMTNVQVRGAETNGIYLEAAVGSSLAYCGIHNCKLRNCGNAGVEISSSSAVDNIVLGNNFNGSFAGLLDAGTGTESAHNIN